MSGAVGVVERLEPADATEIALDGWVLRRSYLEVAPARVTCEDKGGAPHVDVSFSRRDLGDPTLAFDLASASLLSVTRHEPTGKKMVTTYEGWIDAGPTGVRFPKRSKEHPPVGSSTAVSYETVKACEKGDACIAPPADRFVLHWPAKGVVRVPFTYFRGQLVVRAKVGGRDVWALLDSAAGITAIDATMPAAESFKPSLELEGAGSTQKVRLGLGELAAIDLGELHAEAVPAASVPIPALEGFGAKRPELILGYSFFASAAVRIDFKKREIVFSKTPIVANGARSLPVRVVEGKLVGDASVEGKNALFLLDTGCSGGLELYEKWAFSHGIPGERRSVVLKGRFGAGNAETTSTYVRLRTAALGPIGFDGAVTSISSAPDPGIVAGLAGNQLYARCDAVVFDHDGRKLWFEGSCDRPIPEGKIGWRFAKKVDKAYADRPWVVAMLFPGGAAERAGIKIGDRVLEVAGKPVSVDIEMLEAIEQQATGTKVPVVVVRAETKQKEKLVVELLPLLSE